MSAGKQGSSKPAPEGRPPFPPDHKPIQVDSFPFDDDDDALLHAAAKEQHQRLQRGHNESIPSPFDELVLQGLEGSAKWKALVRKEQSILHQLALAENQTVASARRGGRSLLQATYRECQDQGFACARWKGLGFCTYPLYLRYMHTNCEKTCGTCKCQITFPPAPGDPAPEPTCEGSKPGEGCCTESSQCVAK